MGALSEAGLEELITRGCTVCHGKRLAFRTFVDGRLPLMGGEPVGALTWTYDGEKFVDGVFAVSCADCQHALFGDDRCPRCHAPGALPAILGVENQWPVPAACSSCGGDEVRYFALVPARVTYEGKRADKARTTTELRDPGFHGYRADCVDCGPIAQLTDACPLCQAPAPLRPRP